MKNYRYFKLFKLRETKLHNNLVDLVLKRKTSTLPTLSSFFPTMFLHHAANEKVLLFLETKNLNASKIIDKLFS